jgi:hypothetical protein
MKTSPDRLGQMNALTWPQHKNDALAPICDINEQCLQLLVETARAPKSSDKPSLRQLLPLIATLDSSTLAAAARFPFLLVDFGFRDPDWWTAITTRGDTEASELYWLSPFLRPAATTLARSTIMLAWHTARTDAETSLVLLGITPAVARLLRLLRLQDIDRIAERHFRRVRPRWEDRPGVWRQLLICAKSTEVEMTRDFVLHALQLTAGAALPKDQDAVNSAEPTRGNSQLNTKHTRSPKNT